MKKGFTIFEVIVTISLLAIITMVTSSIFVTALKNYQINFQKTNFQKDLNFVVDDIDKNVKLATNVQYSYDVFNSNPIAGASNTLILELPSTDAAGNFIYISGALKKDVIVYYLENGALHRKIYASSSGIRYPQNNQDVILINNVINNATSPLFSFLPDTSIAKQIKVDLKLGKMVEKTNVRLTGTRTATLRNK